MHAAVLQQTEKLQQEHASNDRRRSFASRKGRFRLRQAVHIHRRQHHRRTHHKHQRQAEVEKKHCNNGRDYDGNRGGEAL